MAENVKCKNCNRLKNHWCKAVIDSPDEDMERNCRHFEQKTNGDRIRAMSDEELAELLEEMTYDSIEHRAEHWLRWLKQPAE